MITYNLHIGCLSPLLVRTTEFMPPHFYRHIKMIILREKSKTLTLTLEADVPQMQYGCQQLEDFLTLAL